VGIMDKIFDERIIGKFLSIIDSIIPPLPAAEAFNINDT